MFSFSHAFLNFVCVCWIIPHLSPQIKQCECLFELATLHRLNVICEQAKLCLKGSQAKKPICQFSLTVKSYTKELRILKNNVPTIILAAVQL